MAIDKVTSAAITDGTITSSDLASGTIANQSAFKNIIINGDMSIAQRGTSSTSVTAGNYTVDRFRYSKAGSSPTFTISQDTTVPSGQGFSKSLKLEVTTTNATTAAEWGIIEQKFEGQNLQYLKKGTSSAESLTLSFWVKASKTGTYIIRLDDNDNTRQISKSYTISTANTWEKKTLTFDGDTSGTLDNDNAQSLSVEWCLFAGTDYTSGTLATSWESNTNANSYVGQVDAFDTVNNTFFLTGVQLEAGTAASDFEFLPYDINRDRCYRYYYKVSSSGLKFVGWGQVDNDDVAIVAYIDFKTDMRVAPSAIETTGSASNYQVREALTYTCSAVPTFNSADLWYSTLSFKKSGITSSNGFAQGELLKAGINSGYLAWSAEL
jgi:hypothetical protein